MFYKAVKLCLLVIAMATIGSHTVYAQDSERKERTYKRKYYKDRKPEKEEPVVAKEEKAKEPGNEKVNESYQSARKKYRKRYRDGAR